MMVTKRKQTAAATQIHLLDVGHDQYGDSVLCQIGGLSVLIDGGHRADYLGSTGHPSIPFQLNQCLTADGNGAVTVDLLVVSHAHDDHIGCLPEMVSSGRLKARSALMIDPALAFDSSKVKEGKLDAIDGLIAMLREEPRDDVVDSVSYAAAAADVAGLPQRYATMIAQLKKGGTKVSLQGKDSLADLEKDFASIGLRVLGPSQEQLEACRDAILGFHVQAKSDFAALASSDAGAFSVYEKFRDRFSDDIDAFKGPGPALNLQSSAIVLDDGNFRYLFTGDSQLEKPGIPGDAVKSGVADLLAQIAKFAPYAFVKLGHHCSDNAFGEKVLSAIGEDSVNFGICTGDGSRHHPNPNSLALLKANKARLTWVRTDRNGLSTFTFASSKPTVQVARHAINDLSPPQGADDPVAESATPGTGGGGVVVPQAPKPPAPSPMPIAATVVPVPTTVAPALIEIRIPYLPELGAKISMTLEIVPGRAATIQGDANNLLPAPLADTNVKIDLAGGRKLPPLLFVTNQEALSRNVGSGFVQHAMSTLRQQGHQVLLLPDSGSDVDRYTAGTLAKLKQTQVQGVVLLGGYDVIPAQRRDALPPSVRARVGASSDPDNFTVWSDAVYGDVDGDGLGELPVSRIPDGRSARLVAACLSAAQPATQQKRSNGVRNAARDFAHEIYTKHFQRGPLEITKSAPDDPSQRPYPLDGLHVYLMLHGDYTIASTFWGEDLSRNVLVPAVELNQVNVPAGSIIFSGACWGALTVRERAIDWRQGQPLTPRTADDSLALAFLDRGSMAYVGCTGVHYSPTTKPYGYYGGPLHDAFWGEVRSSGLAPAQALFNARKTYLGAIPHESQEVTDEAIERKLYEQFTCLGLGW